MSMISRRSLLAASALVPLIPAPAPAASIPVTLYKNPQCSCCEAYAGYLRQNGFTVDVVPSNNLVTMARDKGVPEALDGCHISMIEGYVVIGHVPIDAVHQLLAEKPRFIGVSIPAMPMGLPGMPGPRSDPVSIYEIAAGAAEAKVFMTVS